MKPLTERHLALLRRHMVEIIDMHFELAEEETRRGTLSPALRGALLDIPRHLFVPAPFMAMAYQDAPIPIGFDKTLSQPFIGALMIDLLEVEAGHKILEIGTGLGWQAAVLARLGARLFSVEVVEEFAQAARLRLASLGHDVEIRVGDGSRGWSDHAPFDRILVTAAAEDPPSALVDQLAPGGRMVIPLGDREVQQLTILTRQADGDTTRTSIMPVRFTQLETA